MRLLRCVVTAVLGAVLLAVPVAGQSPAKLRPEIRQRLAATGEAEVFVMVAGPALVAPANLGVRRRAVTQARDAVLASVSPADVRVHRRFKYVSGFTASVTARGLERLLADRNVVSIDPPQYGSGALARSVPQIRADAVHRRDDLGEGVTVAVLDTGVDVTHPDLAGSIVDEHCFCSVNYNDNPHCCPNGEAEQSGPGSAASIAKHGTYVTGVIVSKGIVASSGVAPGSKIVAVKVLADDEFGSGSPEDWVAALEWILDTRPDVQLINMSLQTKTSYAGPCDEADATTRAFAQIVALLRARGTLTLAASGNYFSTRSMTAPACVSTVVSVGAVDRQDVVAQWSNADAQLDLLGPGVDITSAGPQHGTLISSGTSIAAPHATGTAALLLSVDPTLTADALEGMLKSTGVPIRDWRNGLSFPRLNALAALNALVNAMRPLSGGGPWMSDCLIEWNVDAPAIAAVQPQPSLVCRDGDPACDHDQTPGQCTFALSACFNVPDRRLPSCTTDAPIVQYQVLSPGPSGSAADLSNAAAISAATPPLPITGQNVCTGSTPFVVPVGTRPGVKWLRFLARAADGRTDYDRVRLTCLPAKP